MALLAGLNPRQQYVGSFTTADRVGVASSAGHHAMSVMIELSVR